MKLTKIFCAIFIAFVIVAFGSTAQTPKPQGCNDPPWLGPGPENKCKFKQRTTITYYTINWPHRKPPETDCYLNIYVCGFELKRNTKNPLGTRCPEAKDFAQPTICCDEFDKAVKSKQPCDPMQDADCDGIPNDKDGDPLKQSCDPCPEPNATLDPRCVQLGQDIVNAYKQAGASTDTASVAGTQAVNGCEKKICEAKRNPDRQSAPTARIALFGCPDNEASTKCCQLFLDVGNAYIKAESSAETANDAAGFAMIECRKKYLKK